MSRRGTKKKAGKAKRKAPERRRPYWTLLLWLLAIGVLLIVQSRRHAGRQNAAVEEELQRLEQDYEERINELQLQVELLQSQIDSDRGTTTEGKSAR